MNTTVAISDSVNATHNVAKTLTPHLSPGTILALHGDLGSGKTCFVTGIANALGISEPITSPTFTMINEYEGMQNLCHMDLYCISNPDELFTLGLEDYFNGNGITIIEWAERAGDLLPEHSIHICFEVLDAPNSRKITITSPHELPLPMGQLSND